MSVVKQPGGGPKFILLLLEIFTFIGIIYISRSLNRIENSVERSEE